MKHILGFLLAVVLVVFSTFSSARELTVGTKYRNSITLDYVSRHIIPLPPGEWELFHTWKKSNNVNDQFQNIVLIQVEKQSITHLIGIVINEDISSYGWYRSEWCDRDDFHFSKVYENYDVGNQDCYIVNHVPVNFRGSKLEEDQELGDKLLNRGIAWAKHHLTVYFRFADASERLTINYHFNPAVYGFKNFPRSSWEGSPWHPDSITTDAKRVEFVNSVKEWAEIAHAKVRKGWNDDDAAAAGLPSLSYKFKGSDLNQTPTEKLRKKVSPTQRHPRQSPSNMPLDKAEKKCAEIGFTKGTEKYGDCVMKLLN